MFSLKNRAVIELTGEDRITFLQGLLTCDVTKTSSEAFTYGLMLTPQGRFLYDFFILADDDKLLLDVQKEEVDEIIKKFKIYKLRSKVETTVSNLNVYASISIKEGFFVDPRTKAMGFRALLQNTDASEDFEQYEAIRIKNLVPDATSDLFKEKSFPLEYEMDKLNAIDFEKGCYVGQEVTARTFHRGIVRKKLYHYQGNHYPKGIDITVSGHKIGITLGKGLCLLNQEDFQNAANKAILVNNEEVTIIHG